MAKPLIQPGLFLVAAPTLVDPNFHRSVVLVCQHSKDGTLGLVVNRPTTLDVAGIFPKEAELWQPCGRVFQGGPVQPETVMVLHALGEAVSGSLPVSGEVSLGGSHEAMETALRKLLKKGRAIRLFLGYAGWGARQLEDEVAEGSWILAPAAPKNIFSERPLELWQSLIREYQRPPGFPGPRQAYDQN